MLLWGLCSLPCYQGSLFHQNDSSFLTFSSKAKGFYQWDNQGPFCGNAHLVVCKWNNTNSKTRLYAYSYSDPEMEDEYTDWRRKDSLKCFIGASASALRTCADFTGELSAQKRHIIPRLENSMCVNRLEPGVLWTRVSKAWVWVVLVMFKFEKAYLVHRWQHEGCATTWS